MERLTVVWENGFDEACGICPFGVILYNNIRCRWRNRVYIEVYTIRQYYRCFSSNLIYRLYLFLCHLNGVVLLCGVHAAIAYIVSAHYRVENYIETTDE